MKSLIVSFVFIGICNSISGYRYHAFEGIHREPTISNQTRTRNVDTKYIVQRVNNFDPQDYRTWNMRYMSNDEHYISGGPIFIFVGHEGVIGTYLIGGHIYDMAKDLNAHLFCTESRYYGLSRPTIDTSTENLKYLNVDQVLADLAHFIKEMKAAVPGARDSGVILIGGSHSVWFRQKYPHLVNGAWASSASILAKVDFFEYFEVASDSIKLVGGEKCSNRIESAINQMEDLVKVSATDRLISDFKLCPNTNFDIDLDVWNFFNSIAMKMALVVQSHRAGDIESECSKIMDSTIKDDISALAKWYTFNFGDDCSDISYESMIKTYKQTQWTALSIGRIWLYQKCAQFGWLPTSVSKVQIFGSSIPLKLHIKMCEEVFSNIFSEQRIKKSVQRTNMLYGQLNPEVTNIFFTNGQLDPWRQMGIHTDLNEYSPAVVIPLASLNNDLDSISANDSTEMKAAKDKISELVKIWLNMPNDDY